MRWRRALFGASTPFAKLLVEASDPQLLAGLLYLGAGVGLMIGQAARAILGVRNPEAPLRRSDAPWMIAIITSGGILGPLFLMLGLARTSAASGSLLLNLEGLATMAIAWVVFRENVDRRLLLGAVAILAGAVALSWQGQGIRVDEGGLLIAAACLAWGVDNNLTRRLSVADPVVIALIKGVAAGSVKSDHGAASWSAHAIDRRDGRGVGRRILRRGPKPRAVCLGAAPSRQRSDWGLFLARAVHWRGHRD